MTELPDNPSSETPRSRPLADKPAPDKADQPRDAMHTLVWLQGIRDAHHALIAAATPEDRMEEALQRVDYTVNLLKGEIAHGNALDALRCLIATGAAQWDAYPTDESLPPEKVIEYLVPSLLCDALWQIVTTNRLPEHWLESLRELTSPVVADWVKNVRAVWRNDPQRWHRTLQQVIASDTWRDARQHLLDDMANPQGGAAAIEDMLTAHHGKRKPVNGRKSFLLAVLLSSVAGKSIEGVIGNNADRLVLQFLDWLQKTLVPAPAKAATPDTPTPPPATVQPTPTSTSLNPYVEALASLTLCHVPAGPFWMGDSQSQIDEEKPLHQVNLSNDYWIGRTSVTVREFLAYCYLSGHPIDSDLLKRWQGQNHEHPIMRVTWREALAFCEWLSTYYRSHYGMPANVRVTLPSEAEWEKAARGGIQLPINNTMSNARAGLNITYTPALHTNPRPARQYPWGDEKPDENRCNIKVYYGYNATPVKQFSPQGDSPYGCCDMAGNVWEWTRSIAGRYTQKDFEWTRYPYHPGDWREDLQRGNEWRRVLRGGAFSSSEWGARCAYRLRDDPHNRDYGLGFRVVVSPF